MVPPVLQERNGRNMDKMTNAAPPGRLARASLGLPLLLGVLLVREDAVAPDGTGDVKNGRRVKYKLSVATSAKTRELTVHDRVRLRRRVVLQRG